MMLINRTKHLREYFDTNIKPHLVRLEKYMKIQQYALPISALAFIALLFDIFMIFMGLVFLIGITSVLFTNSYVKKTYKNQLMLPLMAQLGEGFDFEYEKGLEEKDLRESKLVNLYGLKELHFSKLLTFTDQERTLYFSHLKLTTQYEDADNELKTETSQALLFKAPTKMKITKTTIIHPDLGERALGFIGEISQNKEYNRLQKIRLDSPDFEKRFVVYSEDTIEAHYLLSHTVMERLSEIEQAYPTLGFLISFTPEAIYIYVSLDWLEPHVVWNKEAVNSYDSVKQDFELIFSLIDTLHAIENHHSIRINS